MNSESVVRTSLFDKGPTTEEELCVHEEVLELVEEYKQRSLVSRQTFVNSTGVWCEHGRTSMGPELHAVELLEQSLSLSAAWFLCCPLLQDTLSIPLLHSILPSSPAIAASSVIG